MRAAFVRALVEIAEGDPRVMLLTGDLGFMALEPFAQRFPERFINVGVAEQNMLGIATGLAEAGFIPFAYSIVTFASLRAYEFLRNGPILHQFQVRVVGMGGGFEYGPAGTSHHGLEDVGVMRIQPGISIIAPADHEQTRTAIKTTWNLPGPVYYRLGKDDKTVVPGLNGEFQLGAPQRIRDGTDILILTMGSISVDAVAAAEKLSGIGVTACVLVIASLSPPPAETLAAELAKFKAVVTVEAHYEVGGIGSLVCELIAQRGLHCRVGCCAVHKTPHGLTGSTKYLHSVHGLSPDAIARTAYDLWERANRQ